MANLFPIKACFMILLVTGCFGSATGTIPAESSSAATSSECYGNNLAPVCPTGSQIAITSYYDGFKADSLNCPVDGTATGNCCTYNASGDCLQENPTESRYVYELSGKDSGVISTSSVAPTSGETCNSGSYSPVSVFSQMTYLCIPGSRSLDMCTSGALTNADPVYIQNRGYSSGNGIVSSDTFCNCSVENSAYTDIIMYVIHMDLYDVTDCHQSFTIRDGNTLTSYDCTDLEFNKITNQTFTWPYLVLTLLNSLNSTNAGKFWIGFQAAMSGVDLTVNCPSREQQYHTGCPLLSNTNGSTVTVPTTAFDGVATYACKAGYDVMSGNVTRTCQANNTWSGSELICVYVCKILQNPTNGVVSVTSNSRGGVATYSCDADYRLVDGEASRTCVESTGWNGSEPRCQKECTKDSDCDINYACDTGDGVCRNNPDGSESSDSGLPTWGIILIVLGSVLVLVVFVILVVRNCCCPRNSARVNINDDDESGTTTSKELTENNAEENGTAPLDTNEEPHSEGNKKGTEKLRAHQSVHAEMDKLQLFK